MRDRRRRAASGLSTEIVSQNNQMDASSHRRRNPLTGEWVLVSPHRMQRPWQGAQEAANSVARVAYDPQCYLCPGNVRANGARNPQYGQTFAFTNDFSALSAEFSAQVFDDGLFASSPVNGECRVLCYSPRHDLSLGELPLESIVAVVTLWREQWIELAAKDSIAYALIFENRGEMMGASNPHPHGQIWATGVLPDEVEKELKQQRDYFQTRGQPLLLDYVNKELQLNQRIVCRNQTWVALVPFWAAWPFELMLLPTRSVSGFDQLSSEEQGDLAQLLQQVSKTYDALFGVPFPYSMGWHARPCDGQAHDEWILHAHFYPPLLRSASVRKFQVGFEMLGMPQRDLTPEKAVEMLRNVKL